MFRTSRLKEEKNPASDEEELQEEGCGADEEGTVVLVRARVRAYRHNYTTLMEIKTYLG